MKISDVNEKSHENFLKWLIYTLIAGILVVLSFVVFIDPYNLYGSPVIYGVNAVKPIVSRHIEEIKVTQAVKLAPDTLILGNSRAEIGFDPESPAFMRRGFSVYNLAISGTSIATANRQLEYLLKKRIKPKRIILAIDFIDFMQIASNEVRNDETDTIGAEEFPVDLWFWRFDSLFSMASIKDSLRTVFIQHDDEAATMTARGFNPLKEYLALARNEGYFALFHQKAEDNAKVYLKKSGGSLDKAQLRIFRRMLDNGVNADSEVIVVIYPYHAQILALFEETSLLPAFVNWKREVVAETSDLLTHRPSAHISIIDFSGYGSYQCEFIPTKGDRHSMTRWYWEAGHFKKSLGDVAMERLMALAEVSSINTQDQAAFGVILNQANFNSNLERIAMERKQCVSNYPQLFEEAKTLVRSVANK